MNDGISLAVEKRLEKAEATLRGCQDGLKVLQRRNAMLKGGESLGVYLASLINVMTQAITGKEVSGCVLRGWEIRAALAESEDGRKILGKLENGVTGDVGQFGELAVHLAEAIAAKSKPEWKPSPHDAAMMTRMVPSAVGSAPKSSSATTPAKPTESIPAKYERLQRELAAQKNTDLRAEKAAELREFRDANWVDIFGVPGSKKKR